MKKITPFLWFDKQAEEAARFYVSIFKNSKVISVSPMITTFVLDGQEFMALNGGPQFKFTEAISMYVDCATQEEVDSLWIKLSAGGQTGRCGWLKDKFGLSWQIVPSGLRELMQDKNPEKSKRVMEALLKMDKLEIQGLEKAFRGE